MTHETSMTVCPSCGSPNAIITQTDDIFCPDCGYENPMSSSESEDESTEQSSH